MTQLGKTLLHWLARQKLFCTYVTQTTVIYVYFDQLSCLRCNSHQITAILRLMPNIFGGLCEVQKISSNVQASVTRIAWYAAARIFTTFKKE